jgi:hypothetical protein
LGKAIGIIATVTAGVALAATGIGAIALPGLAGAVSIFGVSTSTLLLASTGLSLVAGYLNKKSAKPETTITGQKQSIPPRIRAFGRSRLHAYYALYKTAPDGSAVDTLAFMDGPADAIEQVYLNDDKVTISGGYIQGLPNKAYQGNHVLAGYTKGAYPNTAFSAVMAKISSYTAKFRGDGVVTGYLIKTQEKEKYYLETYPQGDNVEMSLVARWGYQYDPRDASQNIAHDPTRADMWSGGNYIGTWKWTENPVLHLLWFLVWDRGYDYATRIAPTVEYWKAAANVCDEAITLKAGGTEPRYRSCVSYAATSAEKEILSSIIETFDGWIEERGDGAFVIYAGKVYTPTVTIGPDEIISSNLQNFIETENGIDQVKVTYVSSLHDYTEVEATPWGNIGGTRVGTIDAATPSYSQNRRLAKRIMDRTNATQRGSITTTLAGRKVRGQRFIYLNHTEGDITFFSGLVEITKLSRNFETGGLDFDWIAVDPNIDAWNPATEEGSGAAVGDTIAPDPVSTPAITSATVNFSADSGAGAPGAFVRLIISAPNRDDLTWYARTKLSAATVWGEREYTDLDSGPSVQIDTEFVPTDAMVDCQVAYRTGAGINSDWSPTVTVNTSTATVKTDYDGGNASGT